MEENTLKTSWTEVVLKSGKKAIINSAGVSFLIEGSNKNESIVAFISSEDYLTVELPLEEIATKMGLELNR